MYNEKETVADMVSKATGVLESSDYDYEVLIIDDGSSDGSEKIADELALRNPRVRVVRHVRNRGYGAALRTGFLSAMKELVFYTDCDAPIDLQDIKRALELMEPGVDLVIGYRIKRYDTFRRFVYSKIYNFLCRVLLGIHVRDVNFSFKLIRREVLQRIRLRYESVFIDGELLAEAVRYGFRIREIPIQYFPRSVGYSNFDSINAALHTFQEMLGYWWNTRVLRLP